MLENREESNRPDHKGVRIVLTSADNSFGDCHILNLLHCFRPFGFVIGSYVTEWQGDVIFAFSEAGQLLQDHIIDVQSVIE